MSSNLLAIVLIFPNVSSLYRYSDSLSPSGPASTSHVQKRLKVFICLRRRARSGDSSCVYVLSPVFCSSIHINKLISRYSETGREDVNKLSTFIPSVLSHNKHWDVCEDEASEWWSYLLNAFICSQRCPSTCAHVHLLHVVVLPSRGRVWTHPLYVSLHLFDVFHVRCVVRQPVYTVPAAVWQPRFSTGIKNVRWVSCVVLSRDAQSEVTAACLCCFLPGCIVLSSFFNPIVKSSHFCLTQAKRFIFISKHFSLCDLK